MIETVRRTDERYIDFHTVSGNRGGILWLGVQIYRKSLETMSRLVERLAL
jgi:hypothetical protein